MAEIEADRRKVVERVVGHGQTRSSAAPVESVASPLKPLAELLARRRALVTGPPEALTGVGRLKGRHFYAGSSL